MMCGYRFEPCNQFIVTHDNAEHDKQLDSQTDVKYKIHEQERLNRPRQLENNGRCLKSTSSHQVTSFMDDMKKLSILKANRTRQNLMRGVGNRTMIQDMINDYTVKQTQSTRFMNRNTYTDPDN